MNLIELTRALVSAEHRDWSVVRPEKKEQILTHPFYAPRLAALRAKAAGLSKEEIPVIRYSAFKLYDENGSRTEFQALYNRRREMLIAFALDVLFDGKSISDLEDILWAICDEYSWCLTAHFGYGGTRIPETLEEKADGSGFIQAHLHEQPEVIDLCNAATAAGLAEVVYLLQDRLAPAVTYRVRREIERRVIRPFMDVNVPCFWEVSTHNWGAVCAGNIGVAAIYMIPDSRILAPILMRCIQNMECYISGFTDDGACPEGLGYWSYGFSSFLTFADLVKRRSGGYVNLFADEKVHRIALFQQNTYLTRDNVVSFSDTGVKGSPFFMTAHYLKSIYPDVIIPDTGTDTDMLGNIEYVTIVLREFLWSNPDYHPEGTPDGDVCYPDCQWGISHASLPDGTRTAFAVKGGNNAEPHNHNDIGAFMLDVDGEVLICDPGGGLYNKAYFSEKRYDFLAAGSQGHSVPIVDGYRQKAGPTHRALNFHFTPEQENAYVSMDLAPAYDVEGVQSILREITFNRQTASLTLEDRFQVTHPMKITERIVTKFPVTIESDGQAAVIHGTRHSLKLTGSGLSFRLTETAYQSHEMIPLYLIDAETECLNAPIRIDAVLL